MVFEAIRFALAVAEYIREPRLTLSLLEAQSAKIGVLGDVKTPGVLVMTRGEAGAVALDGDVFHAAPSFDVKVVDATGAGDVFRAGFIFGLLQKWAVPTILRFANAAAALSCTRLGAIPSVPALADVDALVVRGH